MRLPHGSEVQGGQRRADATWQVSQSYVAYPEIGKLLRNRDFRHALALGIDRDQLNETFWRGIGTPGSIGGTGLTTRACRSSPTCSPMFCRAAGPARVSRRVPRGGR